MKEKKAGQYFIEVEREKYMQDKEIIKASFEWLKDNPCEDCTWELSGGECELYNNHCTKIPCFKLREAIKNHPDYEVE